jgi:SAM-dependent methyltransferase
VSDDRADAIRALWSSGSYADVGDRWAFVSQQLVDELDATVGLAGRHVLDAACGTGNTTLALARAGARVVGVDLTPKLLAIAADRAEAAGLDVDLREGDLLDLPAPSDAFDVVTSTFGAFISDDPHGCAAELVRVARPGGTIALTAWTDAGPFELIRGVVFDAHPELRDVERPDGAAWARRAGLQERFAGTGARLVDLDIRLAPLPFDSVEHAVAFLTEHSGPTLATRRAVEDLGGDWDMLMARVVDAWRPHTRPADGGIELLAPYGRAVLVVDD